MGSRFCAVMEEQLCFLDDSGEVRAAYSCGSDYLRRVDCGDGYAALLLGRYRNGTQHRLVTVDSDGQVMASLDVDGEVLSMSAAGRYIACCSATAWSSTTRRWQSAPDWTPSARRARC